MQLLAHYQPMSSELPQAALFLLVIAIGVGAGAAVLFSRPQG